jgi:AraC-like DNA-binding protein
VVLERLAVPAGRVGNLWRYRNRGHRWVMHRHRELEVNLVLRGRAAYLMADGRHELATDHLLFLFPAQEHLLLDESPDFMMWGMVIAPEAVASSAVGARATLGEADPPRSCHWRLAPARARALAELWSGSAALARADTFNRALPVLLCAAWDEGDALPPGLGTPVHPAVERAARRLAADPGLDGRALARLAGLSGPRLSRLFHREMGTTVVAYRNRIRLERLRELLQDPRQDLLAAALAAGFGSYTQCHRVVRALTGGPPARLRTSAEPAR